MWSFILKKCMRLVKSVTHDSETSSVSDTYNHSREKSSIINTNNYMHNYKKWKMWNIKTNDDFCLLSKNCKILNTIFCSFIGFAKALTEVYFFI
jgi:hypothetical protein